MVWPRTIRDREGRMGRTGPKRLQIPWRNLAELARDLRRTYSIAMIYQFGPFELDLATVELRGKGEARSLEPQVFALLALLVENHARLVSKDEIIEKVWDGRIVSDAAVASRVKSARQALGDDGQSQRFIKTIHGQGFRFVAEVRALRGSAVHLGAETGDAHGTQDVGVLVRQLERVSRPSLAVLPFRTVGDPVRCEAI